MSDYSSVSARFEAAGQGHVFAFWNLLNDEEKSALLAQAAEIDLVEIDRLTNTLVKGGAKSLDLYGLEPAPFISRPEHGGDASLWNRARERGEAALRAGKVAAFTVAGGQGTRLGYDGPKGTFAVTPIKGKPLFQVFAEKIAAASARHGKTIPWLIMTSHANHAATVAFFEQHQFFGLPSASVIFFTQGRMPAVDFRGKILLETTGTIALSPDGHGGSLRAMVRSGAIAKLKALGVEVISYFQVDNPLVRCIDPEFIGFHLLSGGEMSSKMIPKAYPLEKVGHFCTQNGRTVVIEYSDLPNAMQEERLPNGQLRYLAGSIAIHCLGVNFVQRAGGNDANYALPFHRADKKIKTVDATGAIVNPTKPNGVKFEMFVFDAVPFAKDTIIIETLRQDDFSPVKNAEGVDSPLTCKNDQVRQWTRWALAAGVVLPTDETGLPPFAFEISPLFADTEEAFLDSWKCLTAKPLIAAGTYLGYSL
ncbi:MAG: UDPGP type 1 family protein [Verrucomicrobiota bacterium]|nr:UDPGP type 1 family protein [Verrucomicrobiota bacterium]